MIWLDMDVEVLMELFDLVDVVCAFLEESDGVEGVDGILLTSPSLCDSLKDEWGGEELGEAMQW